MQELDFVGNLILALRQMTNDRMGYIKIYKEKSWYFSLINEQTKFSAHKINWDPNNA